MTTTPQAALLREAELALEYCIKALNSLGLSKSTREFAAANARQVLAKLQSTQAEPVQAEPTLRDYADSLIKAGHDFWKACNREAGGGAVRWLSCDDGTLIVFTRGEYRDTIMENIGGYKAPEVFFEEDGITAAESKEPVQAGELPPLPEPEISGIPLGMPMSIGNYIRPSKDLFTADQMHAYARAALSARKPFTDEQIEPMFKARNSIQTEGTKDAWYWYAWGVNDGEQAHGIGGKHADQA